MKKNNLMRIGALLFVLTMMTSSFVGGTFAKYVTSGTGTDTARVAKFGVQVTANGETFATEYATNNNEVKGTISKSVVSTDKVVAPGTEGNMASMTLSGTPEVAVKVTYEADLALSSNWTVDGGAVYCPIIITVNGKRIDGATYTRLEDFESEVEEAIKGYSKEYAAGTNLSDDKVKNDALAVSWEWPFLSTDDANDAKDTFLGGQAAAGNAATVTLTVKTTVTQID